MDKFLSHYITTKATSIFSSELVKADLQESGGLRARGVFLCWILILPAAEFLFAFRKHK